MLRSLLPLARRLPAAARRAMSSDGACARPQLKLTRSMWGVLDHLNPEHHKVAVWEWTFSHLSNDGYAAIESALGPFNPFGGQEATAKMVLRDAELEHVGQIHTCSYPVASRDINDHLDSFRGGLEQALEFGSVFVNSHSGVDAWPLDQAVHFFERCVEIEQEMGISVVHETHRQRALYNPWTTQAILEAVPQLKVNADLSHFVVVAERIFDDALDPEWPQILRLIAERCHLIHARVGHAQGPQVSNPADPKFAAELAAHERWWEAIYRSHIARGAKTVYVEPEFGPPNYMQTLPFSDMPVANLWDINCWIGHRVRDLYHSINTE